MRATAAVVLISMLALGACHRREDKAEPPAPPAPAAQAPAAPAAAPVKFQRKPGLWEMQMSMGGVDFVQSAKSCVKAGQDDTTAFTPQAGDDCKSQGMTRTAEGGWRFATVCDMGSGGKVTVVGVASGDFESRYQVRADMSVEGAAVPQMNRKTTMNVDARRIGDC